MTSEAVGYCPGCGTTLDFGDEFCPNCGARITITVGGRRVEADVNGTPEGVRKVVREVARIGGGAAEVERRANPWLAGSFYLVALLTILAVLLVAAAVVPIWVIPLVAVAGILGVVVVGALQLMQDKSLTQKNFLGLMRDTLARLPLLTKSKPQD